MKHCNFHHYAAVIPSYFYTICPFRQLKIILVRHNKQLPARDTGACQGRHSLTSTSWWELFYVLPLSTVFFALCNWQMHCVRMHVLSMSIWSVSLFCSSAKQGSRWNGHAQYIHMYPTHLPIAMSAYSFMHRVFGFCHGHGYQSGLAPVTLVFSRVSEEVSWSD